MKRQRDFFAVFVFFLVISLFLFGLFKIGVLDVLQSPIERTTNPFQSIFYTVSQRIPSQQDQTSELEEENRALLERLTSQKLLEKEITALRDQFQTQKPESRRLLPTRVISARAFIPGISFPESFIIDKGIDHGVRKGLAVVYKDNLVGIIDRVSRRRSSVVLVINSNFSQTAKTIPFDKTAKHSAHGIVRGKGNGKIVLENVVLSETLRKRDIVVTKGDQELEEGGTPPNLIVGKIVSLEKKPSALFQKAEVESFVDFQDLEMIFVVMEK